MTQNFHLISTANRGALQAFAPSFDLIVPTGDPKKGTGGGSWLVMPNFVLALDLAPRRSAYPLFRYVHSIPKKGSCSIFVGGEPDIGIPVDPEDPGLERFEALTTSKVRGSTSKWRSALR